MFIVEIGMLRLSFSLTEQYDSKSGLIDEYSRYTLNQFDFVKKQGKVNTSEFSLFSKFKHQILSVNNISAEYSFNSEYIFTVCDLKNRKLNEIKLLVAVVSKVDHFEKRSAIRQIWDQYHFLPVQNFQIIGPLFFVGNYKLNSSDFLEIRNSIYMESKTYGDIVQVDSVFDSYYTLTEKAVALFNWIDIFCPKTTFIFKCDDDVYTNLDILISTIRTIIADKEEDTNLGIKSLKPSIYGQLISEDNFPNRDKGSFCWKFLIY